MLTRSKKTHIVQVITRLVRGGAQEVTVLIVHRLLKAGYQVTLAHGPGDETLLSQLPLSDPDFHPLYIPEFRRRILPILDISALFRIWNYLRKANVDLVHTHTSKAGIVGRWAARLAKVPVIVHSPRGSIYHPTYYKEPALRFFAWLERITTAFTDKIVTLNESEKADYIRYRIAAPEKFTTIYSGIEIKRYLKPLKNAEEVRSEMKIPLRVPLIGYVSRMTPEKGHLLCLDAFQRILLKVPDAFLVLVGGGPLEDQVRQEISRRNLNKNILITGFRTDVENILPIFDCCIQSSLWDGLPRTMVESMVAGRAVVATAVGGIPEMIQNGETGILVPQNDSEALALGVIDLLKNPDKARRMGEHARKRMEEVFNIDVSAMKLLALYEKLLSEKRKS